MAEDAADRLVARAIESVLDQVPGTIDTSVPEATATKLQPWAETAAPVARNKRPLEALLGELAERVAADPEARASLPGQRHPADAFYDRFGGDRAAPGEGGSRRRRRRRGGSTRPAEAAADADRAAATPSGQRRRRSRRGRGAPAGSATPTPAASSSPQAGSRRRRGRRGRGGGRGPTGGGEPAASG